MGKEWKQWKQCQTLFLGAPKSLQMVIADMKLKDAYSLEEKIWPNSVLKRRDITLLTKVRLVKAIVSPVVLLWMWQRRQWQPTPGLLPGKSHGWRSLEGCSPWGRWGSDTTEWLHFHFSLSCIGEGNGNPLQCSCLENPRDREVWWAAVYGVVQSWTRLKRLSTSSRVTL